MRRESLFSFDRRALAQAGHPLGRLAGCDEVGRGCLAGPLVVAAVVLDYSRNPAHRLAGIDDSKALSHARRDFLYYRILRTAIAVSFEVVSPRTIDEIGLHTCNLRALAACLSRLGHPADLAIVDGFDVASHGNCARGVVGADRRSAAVAAASVVAKVTRDRLMHLLDAEYPVFGFASHVGYATRKHREAIHTHGVCELHRLSFGSLAERQLEVDMQP